MLILLDGRPLQYAGPDNERTRLITMVVASLAREQDIKWMWLVDQRWRPGSIPGVAEEEVTIQRALPGRTGWRLWYDWQIPRMAKKYRPDWVMLTGGIAAGPLPAPQCIWMPVCANPKQTKRTTPLYSSRLGITLRRGESFICFSEKDRAWLAARGKFSEDRIGLARPVPAASPALSSPSGKDVVKATYTEGKEFFFVDVSAAGEDGLIHLLKAFSLFKKRQLSNLQLILAGQEGEKIKEKLATYKYRQDIHWCSAADARDAGLMTAAYAVLFLFEDDSPGTRLLDAWQTGVPVLVAAGTRFAEWAEDAALVAAADDPVSLAVHLMAVYKDEVLRGRLIEKGYSRLTEFAPGLTLARVWAVIGGPYAIIK